MATKVNAGDNIADKKVGDLWTFRKTITDTDVQLFAGITGDMNPLHIDGVYASGSEFKSRLAHGVIGVGILVGIMARELPGGVLLGQSIKFLKPVYIGDTLTACVEVSGKDEEKDLIFFKCWCENQHGVKVMAGEAQGLVRKKG